MWKKTDVKAFKERNIFSTQASLAAGAAAERLKDMCRQMLLKQRKAGPLALRPECCQALRDSFEREARFFCHERLRDLVGRRSRVDDGPLWRELPKQRIPISARSRESVDTWLDALRERKHDAPVVWNVNSSALTRVLWHCSAESGSSFVVRLLSAVSASQPHLKTVTSPCACS